MPNLAVELQQTLESRKLLFSKWKTCILGLRSEGWAFSKQGMYGL